MPEKLQSVSSNQARMSASVNNMSSNATLGILYYFRAIKTCIHFRVGNFFFHNALLTCIIVGPSSGLMMHSAFRFAFVHKCSMPLQADDADSSTIISKHVLDWWTESSHWNALCTLNRNCCFGYAYTDKICFDLQEHSIWYDIDAWWLLNLFMMFDE